MEIKFQNSESVSNSVGRVWVRGVASVGGRSSGWLPVVVALVIIVVHGEDLSADRPVLLLAEIIAHKGHVPLLRVHVLVATHGHLDTVDLQRYRDAADGNVGRLKEQNFRTVMKVLDKSGSSLGDRH